MRLKRPRIGRASESWHPGSSSTRFMHLVGEKIPKNLNKVY
jgi:hypothetical protein